jgi:hypothetical protein
MKIKLTVVLVGAIVAAAGVYLWQSNANVKNYTADGNLAATGKMGCIGLTAVKTSDTPVAMLDAAANCVRQSDYQNAADLYLLSMTYGYFDTLRVSDKTAHQALVALRMNAFARTSDEQLTQLQSVLAERLKAPEICANLQRLGAPAYHPRYMIQHGIQAFDSTDTNSGLVLDFDVNSAWQQTLEKVPKCSSAAVS